MKELLLDTDELIGKEFTNRATDTKGVISKAKMNVRQDRVCRRYTPEWLFRLMPTVFGKNRIWLLFRVTAEMENDLPIMVCRTGAPLPFEVPNVIDYIIYDVINSFEYSDGPNGERRQA